MRRVAVSFTLLLSFGGCTAAAPSSGGGTAAAGAEKDEAAPADAKGETTRGPGKQIADEEAGAAGSELAAPPPPPTEPGIVPITAVTALDTTVAWREVQTLQEAVDLVPVTRGILAKSATGYYAMSDSGILEASAVEAPEADIMGYWPDNAWYVRVVELPVAKDDRSGEQNNEIALMRLRSGSRWVPQEYEFTQRFKDEGQDFRIGNKGGLIVEDEGSFTRVSGGSDAPTGGMCRGVLEDFAETRSGKLYTLCRDTNLYAQIECEDQACVDANAVMLPLSSSWEFTQQVPRMRNSVTFAGSVTIDDSNKPHLLHYETGGWKLEALASAPTSLWPTKDGGLWIIAGGELMHRDPEGVWRKIALPAAAAELSGAMAEDHSEFFLAAQVDGTTKLFATPAAAQAPVAPTGGETGAAEPTE